MKCPQGHTVKTDARYCQTCGSSVDQNPAEQKSSNMSNILFTWLKEFWDDPFGVGLDLVFKLFFISIIIWLAGSIVWGIFGPIFS
jgi:hypothetical protein